LPARTGAKLKACQHVAAILSMTKRSRIGHDSTMRNSFL